MSEWNPPEICVSFFEFHDLYARFVDYNWKVYTPTSPCRYCQVWRELLQRHTHLDEGRRRYAFFWFCLDLTMESIEIQMLGDEPLTYCRMRIDEEGHKIWFPRCGALYAYLLDADKMMGLLWNKHFNTAYFFYEGDVLYVQYGVPTEDNSISDDDDA